MTNRQNQRKIYIFLPANDDVSNTSDNGFVRAIGSVHSIIEGIRSGDGLHMLCKQILLHVRSNSIEPFWVLPVLVQTAGNFADTNNLASHNIAELLDSAIDDVFGYQRLSPTGKVGRRAPVDDGSTNPTYCAEFTVTLPGNVLAILNKETETERLQDLILGLVGITNATSQAIAFETFVEVHYIEKQRNIVLR
jgi:hypothetical protein